MSNKPPKQNVLFLMSDTGGGHRAAAEAIQAAMEQLYPDNYDYRLVDVFRHHTPFPFKYMPEIYPVWVNRSSTSWKIGYVIGDGRRRSKWVLDLSYPLWRPGIQRMFRQYPADVVVCVHSLFNRAALRCLKHSKRNWPPFVTVVTDLVSTPAAWYQDDEDLCLVPTQAAYNRGLDMGLRPDQLKVTGLPINPSFVEAVTNKQEARQALEWDADKLTVLLVSGGAGMGPVFEIARAINAQSLDIQLAIIAGHNQRLQKRLENCHWNQPTIIYPFVDYMARLMTASDIIVTKAGPSTLAEACVAGLPMIISGKVPGQEDGNVDYIIDNGAGVYAPGPELVGEALSAWVNNPPSIDAYSAAAKQLARPRAAWDVAQEIHTITQYPPLHATQPTRPSWSLLLPRLRPDVTNPPENPL